MKNTKHTFIREFGKFRATVALEIRPPDVAMMGVMWTPETPERNDVARFLDDYTTWILDCYKVMARESGQKMMYAQPGLSNRVWTIDPDGAVKILTE